MTQSFEKALAAYAANFRKYPRVLAKEMNTALERSGQRWHAAMVKRVSGSRARAYPQRNILNRLNVRSGKLRNSLKVRMGPTSGTQVSMTLESRGVPYALAQEFGAKIKPKRAKHLWIPGKDNLTPTGRTRKTPSMLMSQPRHTLRFVKGRKGHINVLYEPRTSQSGFNTPRKSRNFDKAKHMFTLVKSVTIPGPASTGGTSRFGFFDTWNNRKAVRKRRSEFSDAVYEAAVKVSRMAGGGAA